MLTLATFYFAALVVVVVVVEGQVRHFALDVSHKQAY